MKPAGVDDPKNIRTASSSVPLTTGSIIESTRRQQVKRERDPNGDEPNDSKKKLKKKNPE